MFMKTFKKTNNQSGFALLITLFVVMAVVTVTVSIIELSMKQLELSITAKDSEIAFAAANAGMECARYLQREASESLLERSPDKIDGAGRCFNQEIDLDEVATPDVSSNGDDDFENGTDFWANTYEVDGGIDWGSGSDVRCTEIKILAMHVEEDAGEEQLEIDGAELHDIFPGWDETDDSKTCPRGSDCFIIQATGYNSTCGTTRADTVKREVLLEL